MGFSAAPVTRKTAFPPALDGERHAAEAHDAKWDIRSEMQQRFMRMMEAHDRVRVRLLGSSHGKSYGLQRKQPLAQIQ